jgi:hypothetical protein
LGKLEGRRPLGRLWSRYQDNINKYSYYREAEWTGGNWIVLGQVRDQGRAVMNKIIRLRIPQNTENFLTR